MKILGKIWGGIKWGLGKVWGGIKTAYGFVRKQPAWKIAVVGLIGVAAVVIASKLSKGGGDMDLYGQGGGGNGIATAFKVAGGALAIGATAELGARAVQGVIDKKKGSGASGGTTGTQPTPVTDVTLPGATSPTITSGGSTKPPTSPMTVTLAGDDQQQEEQATQALEPVDDLDLNISDSEILELENELDAFQQEEEGPGAVGFAASMQKVSAQ